MEENKRRYDLENRLIDFSVEVSDFAENLPQTYTAQYLFKQIIRSSMSPSLNYGEAQVAESRKDFIHKLKIVLKEMKETKNCLEIIKRKKYLHEEKIVVLQKECGELIAIFIKSIETAKRNLNKEK